MEHEPQPEVRLPLRAQFPSPTDDEFLGVMVQVAFMERRRVHGVEKLPDVVEPKFDQAGGDIHGDVIGPEGAVGR